MALNVSFHCRLARIEGRVQGVGYRESCRREADRLGVRGWVRNRADGSVEALMVGDEAALAALTVWLQHGPPSARVTRVRIGDAPRPATVPAQFEVRPSA
ncbi:MAG TPA: acylphosphatase [Burkholderiaceae bacterium]|nr:acylphosphatase [Burkholderiaceae bacterium]